MFKFSSTKPNRPLLATTIDAYQSKDQIKGQDLPTPTPTFEMELEAALTEAKSIAQNFLEGALRDRNIVLSRIDLLKEQIKDLSQQLADSELVARSIQSQIDILDPSQAQETTNDRVIRNRPHKSAPTNNEI